MSTTTNNSRNPGWLLLLLLAGLSACKKDDSAASEAPVMPMPSNFPAPVYDFSKNPITAEGFELGRKLFYDPIFSRDSTIACADCHISYSAFSHPDHATSHGIDGLFGRRNALPIQNLAWKSTFFWDGGVAQLDLVPLNAIQSAVEMDENPVKLVAKLNHHPKYPALFQAAFPDSDTVSGAHMLQALSQFMCMLVSAESRYDHFARGETGGTLSNDERAGMDLFKTHCAGCHATDLFTDQSFRNNGILENFDTDQGRFEISLLTEDLGKFRVPSLRNVASTAPYMHNGKFKTLEAVLNHYANGVKDSPTLDPQLKVNGQLGIALSETDKKQLVAFLKTLTDEDFLKDKRFAKPD